MMTDIPKVIVVDPQSLFRLGVAYGLASTRLFSVVGQGSTADDAVALVTKHSPELAVMDIQPGGSGFAIVERVAAASPETAMIVLTNLDDRDHVMKAFRLGVGGYLLKNIDVSELSQAASTVAAGETYVSRKLVSRLFKAEDSQPLQVTGVVFSEREEQVLQFLSRGTGNKGIAFGLSISEKTVKYYLTNIMKKLHVRNRVEVALFAAQRRN